MRITIIAPENVFELEVNPSMELQDVLALIEAETGTPTNNIALSTDSGTPLTAGNKSLESYGLQGDSVTIFMTFKNLPPSASGSSSSAGPSSHGGPVGFPSNDADLERMRLQALGNPEIMAELRRASRTLTNDPEIADAIAAGLPRFREAFLRQQMRMQDVGLEKQRQIAALNADPYDIEAQKKIEEAIRLEAVDENMQHAMEYSPESFGNVTMLYINVEVNGHAVKAFVDSGAQTTIISPECAEACGIMRLLDPRFAGMALGVGTARILGRIHSAQIKLGELHLPCAFSVLEGKSVDLLFGLDMLKRHQCCIDLSTNTLRINTTEIPFLAEHELPAKARRMEEAELASDMNQAAGDGINPVASPKTGKTEFPGTGQSLGASSAASSSADPSAAGGRTLGGNPPSGNRTGGSVASEADISVLVNLGVSRSQAEQLLEAAGGNVDVAASMLFG